MSDVNASPKGRLWLRVVELLIGFVLFTALFLGAGIPALFWISQENIITAPEQFAAVALVVALAGLLVTSFVARTIVWGRRYTPKQHTADELRHAELFGPQWFYDYLRNMTPDEAARYERSRRWIGRIFIASALTTLPAGAAFDRPILWFIPAAVLGGSMVWTYWRARVQRIAE